MDIRALALYFVIGGTIISAVTYFGSQGKSHIAAFIAMLPSITLVSFITLYLAGGKETTLTYAKSLPIMIPAWIVYIVTLIFLLPRIGFASSLTVGVVAYLVIALISMKVVGSAP